jgi:hypothetical protein
MSIHGILSSGKWQKDLSIVLAENGLVSAEFKYGITLRFDRAKQSQLVKQFRDWYFKIAKDKTYGLSIEEPFHRPSIIAHSLGAHIICKALHKYPEIKFDKVFLHGAIVPREFDWYTLILRDQVSKVVCEQSRKDLIVRLSFLITGSFHPCSRFHFLQKTTYIKYEDVSDFSHSDFQYQHRWESQIKKHLFEQPVQLALIHGSDLEMKSLTKYFKDSFKIDQEIFGEDYNTNPVTHTTAANWAEVEKNIWSFMINSFNQKVVGYINTLAVDDETMETFLRGNINEVDIQANNLVGLDASKALNIIIMSIAVTSVTIKKYGNVLSSKPGELLLIALASKLMQITRNGKYLKRIAAIGWTSTGESVCKAFGLRKTQVMFQGHPIYSSTIKELKETKEVRQVCAWWLQVLRNA